MQVTRQLSLQVVRQTSRQIAWPTMLVIASTLATVLLVEMGLAHLYPQLYQRPPVWEYDARLGWRHKPGAKGRLRTPEFDVEYRIDARGARETGVGNGETERFDGEVLRVDVYGDSFAEGWGVEGDKSMAGQLQTILPAAAGASVRVSNYGVAGYGTDQQLLLYETSGRHEDTDIVILMFYGNDLWNNASHRGIGAERGDKPYFIVGASGILSLQGIPVHYDPGWDRLARERSRGRWAWHNWHIAALLNKLLAPREISTSQQDAFYAGLYGVEAPEYARYWQLTCRLLGRFAQRVTAFGGRFLVVYVPSIVQVDPQDWQRKKERYRLEGDYDLLKPNRILRAWSQQVGVAFLDLGPVFMAQQAAGSQLYFEDSHWTSAGHHLAAIEVERFLTTRAWTASRRPSAGRR